MIVERMIPIFSVDDLAQSVAFYRDVLEFTVAWQFGDPPFRAGVARDGFEIQLDAGAVGQRSPSTVYCHVRGIDDFFAGCQRRGAPLMRELAVRPWGVRDFQVVDPSGNKIGFAELLS
jgi:uncharacterized glyoxalase superfamily protein PhnB